MSSASSSRGPSPARAPSIDDVALALVREAIEDPVASDLSPVGPAALYLLRSSLSYLTPTHIPALLALAHSRLQTYPFHAAPVAWRRLYTDTVLLWTALEFDAQRQGREVDWMEAVARLDKALVIAGAPGEDRREVVQALVADIQRVYLPPFPAPPTSEPPPTRSRRPFRSLSGSPAVPVLPAPPSISAFRALLSTSSPPFILRSYFAVHPTSTWRSPATLLSLAGGPGRIVPVEVGSSYTDDGWAQRMMLWEDFVEQITRRRAPKDEEDEGEAEEDVLYLAQHDLPSQFEKMAADVVPPDYVYCAPEENEAYRPPEAGLVINAWIGGKGAGSPAHTDPYYNFYAQIKSRKRIWLGPPSLSLPALSSSTTSHAELMSNTTSLSPFDGPEALPDDVRAHGFEAVLEEGDCVVFAPGWWHALRFEQDEDECDEAGWGASLSFWF